jgi:hypothetical protein
MDALEVRELIREELPRLLEEDPETKDLVLRLARAQFADRKETESRFDQVLAELQREREAQEQKWEAQEQKWWENQRALDEQNRKQEEQNQRLREEQAQHRAEQDRKWWENQRAIDATLAEIRRIDQRLGAMGARWGVSRKAPFALHSVRSSKNRLAFR